MPAVPRLLALRREPLLSLPGRAVDVDAGVLPALELVLPLLGIPAREEAVEVLGVLEVLVDDDRRVGVVDDVVAEPALALEDVVDDAAEERDVGACADPDPARRRGARAREARVDVD